MASLLHGEWCDEPVATNSRQGEFLRAATKFRNQISPEDAEPNRYHLYVSYACPWAHRTLIARKLKNLDNVISVSVTNAFMGARGWTFGHHEVEYLADVYRAADSKYTGKITVPVLWDSRKETIVNNESSEIIRILNSSFNAYTKSRIDLYPDSLKEKIDEINDEIYHNVNNGVYKAGFASKQAVYETAFKQLFETLDKLEALLNKQPYLVGEKATEADIRLFTTLIRFDVVYYLHFKCNKKRIKDYPALYNYMKAFYQVPAIKETCFFDHIKEHYYMSHDWINPYQIVPLGPEQDLLSPHDRGKVDFYLTDGKLQ